MPSNEELDLKILVQPIEPGTKLPEKIPFDGLFLLNLSSIMEDDVWDDYGNKELNQSGCLRNFANHLIAIADTMAEFGQELKSYPHIDDYEFDDYGKSWEELMVEMSTVFEDGYKKIAELVELMADDAIGGFMD
jgi:hypothetical protein